MYRSSSVTAATAAAVAAAAAGALLAKGIHRRLHERQLLQRL
jgi:hypothetical protein